MVIFCHRFKRRPQSCAEVQWVLMFLPHQIFDQLLFHVVSTYIAQLLVDYTSPYMNHLWLNITNKTKCLFEKLTHYAYTITFFNIIWIYMNTAMPCHDEVCSFRIHCVTCFLGLRRLGFFMSGFLWSLVLKRWEDAPLLSSDANKMSLSCRASNCLVVVLEVDCVVGNEIYMPGETLTVLSGSIRPSFSCCNFNMASIFSLLVISKTELRTSLSSTSILSEPCINKTTILLWASATWIF